MASLRATSQTPDAVLPCDISIKSEAFPNETLAVLKGCDWSAAVRAIDRAVQHPYATPSLATIGEDAMNDAPQAMLVDYAEKVSAPCNSGRGERLDLEIKDLSGTEVALIYKAVKQINEARSIAPVFEPSSVSTPAQDATALADEYEAGLRKMEAAGYEEFGKAIENHKIVIAALRATSQTPDAVREAVAELVANRDGNTLVTGNRGINIADHDKEKYRKFADRILTLVASRSTPSASAGPQDRSDLTKIAAECHRSKWQFDFNDENRLPVGQARDMVKRAFQELHRIGDLALKFRDASAGPQAEAVGLCQCTPRNRPDCAYQQGGYCGSADHIDSVAQAEAVVWRYQHANSENPSVWYMLKDGIDPIKWLAAFGDEYNIQPLYAHPQPQQPDGREISLRTTIARAVIKTLKQPPGIETLDWRIADAVIAVLPAPSADGRGDEIQSSDGSGVRQEDNARSHGESLQQGPDTSSNPSTAATPHGKGSGAASVANPAAASDRPSHAATGPSETIAHGRGAVIEEADFGKFINLIETRNVRIKAETQTGADWESLSLPDRLAKKLATALRAALQQSPATDGVGSSHTRPECK